MAAAKDLSIYHCHLFTYLLVVTSLRLCFDSTNFLQAVFSTFNCVAVPRNRGQHDAMKLSLDTVFEKLLVDWHFFLKECL